MPFRRFFVFVLLAFTTALASSCNRPAGTPQEAADLLTAVSQWKIEEIVVNDAVTFKDGKMTQQFGGIDFQRYMETVQVKKGGVFSGVFKGEATPFLLKWQVNESDITIGAPEGNGKGAWTVRPDDVRKGSFVMKTQSTAYDYPRMTTIALKFKAAP
ncbi:hypothetical protein J2Y45_003323 [Dyadobacter sp. BE34]|uniref:Lipocalin-like domain-containing protein n=1 Tax=Dyadobacter fermentans TaxID=94254 RepID=A0ABU1QYB1_9BACT|nr:MULTISPECIES: hypothetical protein [Dyadobacter]MDR6806131.1 hypothetical protein [Dyadobacter fermentans]MDR7043872.1 hypothetical protein [Dyadobacter sp. BE242]MDR7198183.1 hypothetical protein [Dyadobacter sp. BE34]MDR7216146.1 hypothetical protein [Dyadobacter sp. BE31]MDR7264328.1 hypothetical protein [Dyadobacter sp. BE32]